MTADSVRPGSDVTLMAGPDRRYEQAAWMSSKRNKPRRSEQRELDEATVRAAIAAERTELADMLAGLSPHQWDAPSLCAGWRVREVMAHITMAFRYSMPQVIIGMI